MYEARREEGLEILGVAFVEGGERGRKWLSDYMARKKVTWPNVMAGQEWYGPPMEAYGVGFLPFNLLLDREGRILDMELRGEDIDGAVAQALRSGS